MYKYRYDNNLTSATNDVCKINKIVSKKIEIPKLIKLLCNIAINNSPSYRDIALEYSLKYDTEISKQSFFYLFEDHLLPILTEVIQNILFKTERMSLDNISIYFKRILLQDSTAIKLPDNAPEKYSGMNKKKGCKFQATFDVMSNTFTNLVLTPFTINDQRYSHKIKDNITNKDLIIRDLGYFTSDALKSIENAGAYFITKITASTKVFNEDGKEINLLDYLNKKGEIDEKFYITQKSKIGVRLIAKKVSQEKADRRRRAKTKSTKHKLSKNNLALLSWDIVATNIFDKAVESITILNLYRLRWKIEIIFKAWKSHCQIHKFHDRISEKQMFIYMLIRLLAIILANNISAQLMPYTEPKKSNQKISYLSFMKNLLVNIEEIIYTDCEITLIKLINRVLGYSVYDKRNRQTLLDVEISILYDLSNVCKDHFDHNMRTISY